MKRSFYIQCQYILFVSLFFFGLIPESTAQSHISKDEYTGLWSNADSWNSAVPPTVSNSSAIDIHIRGYITSLNSLSYTGNGAMITVTANDTLVVDANMELKNGSTVSIEAGALLVVRGDFTTKNNLDLSTSGTLVVTGEFEIGNSGEINNSGNIYLYDPSPTTGNSTLSGRPLEDKSDLENNDPDLFNFVENNGTLPVDLVKFEAFPDDQIVKLAWVTASEINNDKFEIYRNADGKNFNLIGEKKGNGTTNEMQNYSYTDDAPINGQTYYQLKQIDFDGQFEYSPIVSVKIQLLNATFEALPTVITREDLSLYTRNLGEGEAKVTIVSLNGQTMFNQQFMLELGRRQKLELRGTHTLKAGIYIVTLFTGENKYKKKIIVNT